MDRVLVLVEPNMDQSCFSSRISLSCSIAADGSKFPGTAVT